MSILTWCYFIFYVMFQLDLHAIVFKFLHDVFIQVVCLIEVRTSCYNHWVLLKYQIRVIGFHLSDQSGRSIRSRLRASPYLVDWGWDKSHQRSIMGSDHRCPYTEASLWWGARLIRVTSWGIGQASPPCHPIQIWVHLIISSWLCLVLHAFHDYLMSIILRIRGSTVQYM